MEVADATGKSIFKGSHVRYTGTGSTGEVLDVKSNEEGTWARVDTTDLWYNSAFLELMDEHDYERTHRRAKQLKEEAGKDDAKVKAKKAVSLKKELESVDMSNELCDGGG